MRLEELKFHTSHLHRILILSLSINIVKFTYTPCRWSFELVVHCLWCQEQRRFLPFVH